MRPRSASVGHICRRAARPSGGVASGGGAAAATRMALAPREAARPRLATYAQDEAGALARALEPARIGLGQVVEARDSAPPGFPAALGYMLVLALLALTIMGALMGKVEAVRPWLSFIESRLLVLQAPWLATHDAPPPKPPEPVHGFNAYGFVKPVECWPVDSEHCKAAKAAGAKSKGD